MTEGGGARVGFRASTLVNTPHTLIGLTVAAGVGVGAGTVVLTIDFGDPHGELFLITTLIQVWSYAAGGLINAMRPHGRTVGLLLIVISLCWLVRTTALLPGEAARRLSEFDRPLPYVLTLVVFAVIMRGESSRPSRVLVTAAVIALPFLTFDAIANDVGRTDPCLACRSDALGEVHATAQVGSRIAFLVTALLLITMIVYRRATFRGHLWSVAVLGAALAGQVVAACVVAEFWHMPLGLWVSLNAAGVIIEVLIALALLAAAVWAWRDLAESRGSQLLRVVSLGHTNARRNIARMLHDGAQLRLLNAAMLVNVAQARLAVAQEAGDVGETATLHRDLRAIADEVANALVELRDMARGRPPSVLEECGLAEALRRLRVRSAVPLTVAVDPLDVPPTVAETVYFTVTEALANAIRHAEATAVTVSVTHERFGRKDGLRVEITDDGVGGASVSGGAGLAHLADRVRRAGGTLRVDSAVDRGTTIVAEVPCRSLLQTTRS